MGKSGQIGLSGAGVRSVIAAGDLTGALNAFVALADWGPGGRVSACGAALSGALVGSDLASAYVRPLETFSNPSDQVGADDMVSLPREFWSS